VPDPDAAPHSWVPVPEGSGFGLDNLPYGLIRRRGDRPRASVRIGDHALDLAAVADAGLFGDIGLPDGVFHAPALNEFLGLGRPAWSAVRARLIELLSQGNRELHDSPRFAMRSLPALDDVETLLPVQIGDYVDFYASIEHATNLGRMWRPEGDPLMPNWRHLPVGYHGRSSSVVVSGTPVVRPRGQLAGDPAPTFEPTRRLDFELELGFVTGPGNALGSPIPIDEAREHIFGVALVNDWSARDIQRWEYQPLGPFLGKSFATSMSPWITPLEALEPFRLPGRAQDPEPLDYLRTGEHWALDLALEVALIPAGATEETVISRTNARGLYWSAAQQLAHATANGANARPGDLYASGTISGSDPGTYGSLVELTWGGRDPLRLAGGAERTFLQDGDTVVLRGAAGSRVRLGEVSGTIASAQ
jgi:fumarylacetoacetase